jgi:hypothetical protein
VQGGHTSKGPWLRYNLQRLKPQTKKRDAWLERPAPPTLTTTVFGAPWLWEQPKKNCLMWQLSPL